MIHTSVYIYIYYVYIYIYIIYYIYYHYMGMFSMFNNETQQNPPTLSISQCPTPTPPRLAKSRGKRLPPTKWRECPGNG